MNFGEYPDMLALANSRLPDVKKTCPKANLTDADTVNVIYLLTDEPKKYHDFAVAQNDTGIDRKTFLAHLFAPVRRSAESLSLY